MSSLQVSLQLEQGFDHLVKVFEGEPASLITPRTSLRLSWLKVVMAEMNPMGSRLYYKPISPLLLRWEVFMYCRCFNVRKNCHLSSPPPPALWLLDNQEIWEFLGMWDHQIYGESYRKNFAVKRAYLLAQGFRLREIHRNEVKSFKQIVDLRSIFSLGDFTCRGCLKTDVKHHAHAMCASCVGQRLRGVEPGTPKKARLRKSDAFACSECKSTNRKKQVRGRCAKCALNLYKVTSSSRRPL